MSATRGLHHALGDVSKFPDIRDAAPAVLLTMVDMTNGTTDRMQVVARHSGRLSNVRLRRLAASAGQVALASGVILAVAAGPGTAQVPVQSATASIRVQPSPEIAGVIKGGTQPQVIATGIYGADDPIWLPEVGLVFSEPNANRIVRLSCHYTLTTFVGGLRRPLGMTFDPDGRLISLQSRAGTPASAWCGLPAKKPSSPSVSRGPPSAGRMESCPTERAACISATRGWPRRKRPSSARRRRDFRRLSTTFLAEANLFRWPTASPARTACT